MMEMLTVKRQKMFLLFLIRRKSSPVEVGLLERFDEHVHVADNNDKLDIQHNLKPKLRKVAYEQRQFQSPGYIVIVGIYGRSFLYFCDNYELAEPLSDPHEAPE
jgi:hypothetical protein